MLQKAVLKFVMGKKDVTKLPTKGKSPKTPTGRAQAAAAAALSQ